MTPIEDRIFHYDATGGKCTIPKYQNADKNDSYNRILTYYCMAEHTTSIMIFVYKLHFNGH